LALGFILANDVLVKKFDDLARGHDGNLLSWVERGQALDYQHESGFCEPISTRRQAPPPRPIGSQFDGRHQFRARGFSLVADWECPASVPKGKPPEAEKPPEAWYDWW
jgi:hypothetical protein